MKTDTLQVPGASLYYEVRGSAAALARLGGNPDLFAGRLIPIIGNYQPDIEALRTSPTRILFGVGDESTPGQMTYQASHELARRLGGRPVRFPGGHGGFGSHPDGFADRLCDALAAAASTAPLAPAPSASPPVLSRLSPASVSRWSTASTGGAVFADPDGNRIGLVSP